MDDEKVFAIVGRLYVGLTLRDNEIRRLNGLLVQYEQNAKQAQSAPADDDALLETADMGTD